MVKNYQSTSSSEALSRFLLENPAIAKKIVEKGILASKARIAAKRAREVTRKKSGLEISNLPGKLADCSSNNAEMNELFIVEGTQPVVLLSQGVTVNSKLSCQFEVKF